LPPWRAAPLRLLAVDFDETCTQKDTIISLLSLAVKAAEKVSSHHKGYSLKLKKSVTHISSNPSHGLSMGPSINCWVSHSAMLKYACLDGSLAGSVAKLLAPLI
jgi:hypothetical protein